MFPEDEKYAALMSIVGFDATDLAANRQGKLSERQGRRIRTNAYTALSLFSVFGIGSGLGIALLSKPPLAQGAVMVGLLLGGGLVAIGVLLYMFMRRDLGAVGVRCAEGAANISGERMGFLLNVGDEHLPVLYDLRSYIQSEQVYRAYYTPNDRRLLSLELGDR